MHVVCYRGTGPGHSKAAVFCFYCTARYCVHRPAPVDVAESQVLQPNSAMRVLLTLLNMSVAQRSFNNMRGVSGFAAVGVFALYRTITVCRQLMSQTLPCACPWHHCVTRKAHANFVTGTDL